MESWQLSLSFGFHFLLPCLKAISAASCQNRHGTRCMCWFLTVATSQCLKWCATSPPGFSPSLHTTSGAVGLPPSSGGGRHRRSLLHISERDPPQDEDRPPRSLCFNICPQLGRTQMGSFSISAEGRLFFCVLVYVKEGLDSCLKTMMR